jgi:hypothetical protein
VSDFLNIPYNVASTVFYGALSEVSGSVRADSGRAAIARAASPKTQAQRCEGHVRTASERSCRHDVVHDDSACDAERLESGHIDGQRFKNTYI